MITLITGFPGSGKSYYAVERIYNLISKNSNDFQSIYTNIGGLKIEDFPKSDIKLNKLKEDELLSYLNECYKLYELYKDTNNVDEHLIKLSKERNFYNTLIVFDECHDFFMPQDKVKIFWLTYHRHLHHEIILLTQNKSLINSKYRAIPEQFIEAQARSKKLFSNTLNYKFYASFAMRKTDLFSSSSIKIKDEIFKLYQSGNKSKQKSILLKFIFMFIIGLVIAISLFIFLLNGFKSEDIEELNNIEEKAQEVKELKPNNINKQIQSIRSEYFNILINYESDNGYLVKNTYYNKFYFKAFINNTKSKIIYTDLIYKTKTYKIERVILRTSKKDLNRFFYIEDNQYFINDLKNNQSPSKGLEL